MFENLAMSVRRLGPDKPYSAFCQRLRPRALRSAVLAMALAATALPAWGACTVSAVGVVFGSYNTFGTAPVDSTGTVTVACDITSLTYTIGLSTGNGTYATRMMNGPSATLSYNLYLDPTRLIVWGDGSAGTSLVAGVNPGLTHTVYGRIPALQNVAPGSYSDTIVVTVSF